MTSSYSSETRRRLQREVRERKHIDTVVSALLTVASRSGNDVEFAAFSPGASRSEPVDEAERLAHDHGFDSGRLVAMRSLARSRGVGLEVVLRACLSGELRSIVEMPETGSFDREPNPETARADVGR